MIRLASLLLVSALLVGCQSEQFRHRGLGQVDYDRAYQAAVSVFSGYYTIASADPESGEIRSHPKVVSSAPDRLLSNTDARELAVLRIRREDSSVWADVRVDIERQQANTMRAFSALGSAHDVPNQTPAQGEGPLTHDQQQAWRVTGHNYELERRILEDLYNRLHPPEDQQPE